MLAGFATAIPKTADGVVEMIRQLKVAHDTAVKDRTGAMVTLKAMLVHSSEDLRRETAKKTQKMVARHCARSVRGVWRRQKMRTVTRSDRSRSAGSH